jgi:hypothetical protein
VPFAGENSRVWDATSAMPQVRVATELAFPNRHLRAKESRHVSQVRRHHGPRFLGFKVFSLPWPVLIRSREKAGAQTLGPRRTQVIIMGRHQHHLVGAQAKKPAGTLVRFRVRLIALPQIRAENDVPRQVAKLPQPH